MILGFVGVGFGSGGREWVSRPCPVAARTCIAGGIIVQKDISLKPWSRELLQLFGGIEVYSAIFLL